MNPTGRSFSGGGGVAATEETIAEAARLLRAGELVAFPTETVYGLGADAGNDRAVAALFAAKGRPQFNPLIAHVATVEAVAALGEMTPPARRLAEHLWPGPLTLVVRRRRDCPVSRLASAGLETLAVRIPDHPVARALLTAVGGPVVAPSANRSGGVSPTTAAHVADSFDGIAALILDGGPCRVGVESTVVDLSGAHPALLRPGGTALSSIERLIGPLASLEEEMGAPRAPGQLTRHYAPNRPVRLEAHDRRPGEVLLGFGHVVGATLNLSPRADLEEAAANLFAMLRALDRPDVVAIAVSPVPAFGLGLAINDRLHRAAADRDENDDLAPRAQGDAKNERPV
ncbi:MAG: tRNA threonylcarbamoyladenosine biosynthesis protein [Rhodospirillaceae bacterium]|nr:MAG: tRNA threonylcarbamoyladenosine biosynthesis protein [Rhodospirillaceae bacterium]